MRCSRLGALGAVLTTALAASAEDAPPPAASVPAASAPAASQPAADEDEPPAPASRPAASAPSARGHGYLPAGPPPLPPGWAVGPPAAYFPQPVPVDLVSTEAGVVIDVYFPGARAGADAPIVSCPGPCRVVLVPGTYQVAVRETEHTVSGSREIDVRGPTRITMDPDTTEHRSVGLGLGIAGPVAMVTGIALLVSAWDDCHYHDGSSRTRCGNDGAETFGLLSLVAGLTATPVGWVMFGTSFKPEYDVSPLVPGGPVGAPGRGSPAPDVAFVAFPAGMGVVGRF